MMGTVDELVEWLRAQLDEDERIATHDGKLRGDQWSALEVSPTRVSWEVVRPGGVVTDAEQWDAKHIALHDPARVLREIESKRRIVRLHRLDTVGAYDADGHLSSADQCAVCLIDFPCPTLLALALPYSDRPGYREEWRP